jgi:hypothetical protein
MNKFAELPIGTAYRSYSEQWCVYVKLNDCYSMNLSARLRTIKYVCNHNNPVWEEAQPYETLLHLLDDHFKADKLRPEQRCCELEHFNYEVYWERELKRTLDLR